MKAHELTRTILIVLLVCAGCSAPKRTAVIVKTDDTHGIIHFVAPYDIEGCGPKKVKETSDGTWIEYTR